MSAQWSTYSVTSMDDAYNRHYNMPWAKGTMRLQVSAQKWFISPPSDDWWATAFGAWIENGDVYDGSQWLKLRGFASAAKMRQYLGL